jgi:dTDP-4-amino-4,6-dideoxygalactose transaminase
MGRPALYRIPASIPALHLGETIYHPAHEPRRISAAAAAIALHALERADRDRDERQLRAEWYVAGLNDRGEVRPIRAVTEAKPGFLRFPVLLSGAGSRTAGGLGVVQTYPRALGEESSVSQVLERDASDEWPGAQAVVRHLVTFPTHSAVRASHARRILAWARST